MFEKMLPYLASQNPRRPAIWSERGEASYAQFEHDVRRFTAALRNENLPSGAMVLIQADALGLGWLLTFALERLGHPTAWASSGRSVGDHLRVVRPAVLIAASEPGEVPTDVRLLRITASWLENAAAQTPIGRLTEPKADDLIHVVLSSGTTGTPKQIPLTREDLDQRVMMPVLPSAGQQRLLVTMGPDSAGGYTRPLASWFSGGLVLLPSLLNDSIFERGAPNTIVTSPQQLASLLTSAPGSLRGPDRVMILVVGSAPPAGLIRTVLERGGADLYIAYGSTESGWVASGPAMMLGQRAGAVGWITPWSEVQIVGPDDQLLRPGEAGQIRVRSVGQVTHYLGAEAETRARFRQEWFYPGDIGWIDQDGVLIVAGRIDEVINLGGQKLSCCRIEEMILECDGISDTAVIALPTSDGQWRLFCAVVAAGQVEFEYIQRRVFEEYGCNSIFVLLPKIPRNGMGKILRPAVRDEILAAVSARPAETGSPQEPLRSA